MKAEMTEIEGTARTGAIEVQTGAIEVQTDS